MKIKQEQYDVGVIVGRFQVPALHGAHLDLIRSVCNEHDKVVILLGLAPVLATTENPLDFEARKQMLLAAFPQVNVLFIKDMGDDQAWSKQLDDILKHVVTPVQSVVLYGGRDSFIAHYSGKHATRELEQTAWVSGNEIRRAVSRKSVKASEDFRAGVIWGTFNRFPTAYPTVDVAILKDDQILLGRKPQESQWRLPGGFVDPLKDLTLEAAALREVAEETGLEVSGLQYLMSWQVDDWRYRFETDKIITTLFVANYLFGSPRAGDDIAEVRWFELTKLDFRDVVSTHHPLIQAVQHHTSNEISIRDES